MDNQLVKENDVNYDLVKNICLSLNNGINTFKLSIEEFKMMKKKIKKRIQKLKVKMK